MSPPSDLHILPTKLPRLRVWRDWDRCEKLRRASPRRLAKPVHSGNPLLEATDTTSSQELARGVFRSPEDFEDPGDFLDRAMK